VDQEVQGLFVKLLQAHSGEGKTGVSELDRQARPDGRECRLEVLRTCSRSKSGDLRMMLRIPPDVELELNTVLTYRTADRSFFGTLGMPWRIGRTFGLSG
jgi:hypothetical protein